MSTIEHSIDVNVPVRTASNLWTQCEAFPRVMEGVEAVTQLGTQRLQWRTNIGGKGEECEAHHGTAPGRAHCLDKYDRRPQGGGGDVPSPLRPHAPGEAPDGGCAAGGGRERR